MHSRRHFLRLSAGSLAALGLGSVGLSGCGDGSEEAAAGAAPARGGKLTFGTTGEPDSWDLHVSVSSISAYALRAVYDSLVHEKSGGTFEPWLAKSWQISADGLRYTFVLRDDVTFSDGTPFNALAVKVNLDHVVNPKTQSRNAKTLLGPYKSAEVVDEFTVAILLSEPFSPLLGALSSPYLGFHSPKTLGANAADIGSGGKYVVSTGPFVFASLTSGQHAVFTRRTGYNWAPPSVANHGEAYVDSYTVQFLGDDAARIGALTSGQLDVADQVPSTRLAELKTSPGIELSGHDPVGMPFTYGLNTTKAPFDERDVRRAFQSAVDVDSITNGLFQKQYSRGWSPITPSTPGYDRSLENAWGYDLAKSQQLLDSAGFTTDSEGYRIRGGQRLTVVLAYAAEFTTSEQLNFHTALKDAVKKAGFELTLRPLDTPSIVKALGAGDYHLGAGAAGSIDASVLRTVFYSTNLPAAGGANTARVKDREIDAWLDDALRTTDTAAQNALYAKVQQKVVSEAFVLPTYIAKRTLGVQKRVHGFDLDAQGLPQFAGAWVR